MDKKKLYKKGDQEVFRVNTAFNIKVEGTVHQDYKIDTSNRSEIAETGLLTIFSIVPNNERSPGFQGRWDENKAVLDIDILKVSDEVKKLFLSQAKGYVGHHTKRTIDSARIFEVHIQLQETIFFSGTASFNIGHGHDPELAKRTGPMRVIIKRHF